VADVLELLRVIIEVLFALDGLYVAVVLWFEPDVEEGELFVVKAVLFVVAPVSAATARIRFKPVGVWDAMEVRPAAISRRTTMIEETEEC